MRPPMTRAEAGAREQLSSESADGGAVRGRQWRQAAVVVGAGGSGPQPQRHKKQQAHR